MVFVGRIRRWRTRQALPPDQRLRLAGQRSRREQQRSDREVLAQPLALARFVTLDLETTGPRMLVDTIISMGAVAVAERSIRHADAFERVLRQERSSAHDNILIHQIGGQAQAAGHEPASALLDFLDYLGGSVAVAYRAEFDATVLARELETRLGIPLRTRFIDLAVVLPALFPDRENVTLDDWILHFGLPPIGRHHAIADAYASAQLWLLALEQAAHAGLRTVAELIALERAQRWLGKRH
jgi:DNA polymerase III subunit epsilon